MKHHPQTRRIRSLTRRTLPAVLAAGLAISLGAAAPAATTAGASETTTTATSTTTVRHTAEVTGRQAVATDGDSAPKQFVALYQVAPTILHDIRYYTRHNFVGQRIQGYREPLCILTRPAAKALAKAQIKFIRRGYLLKVYDCYRPQRAVDHFVRWAKRLRDERMKAEFYPRVDKSRLFEDGYIAERSGHSRGSTVDLTLVKLPPVFQPPWFPWMGLTSCFAPYDERYPDNTINMGTGYDCFDTLSHTLDPRIKGKARANRLLLKSTLESVGFVNYENEWWHYTYQPEPFPNRYFDFPVSHRSLR
jgi:zinc D-Ala-D-Ala dipeptidase